MHSADLKAWVAVNQDYIVPGHKLYETMFENLSIINAKCSQNTYTDEKYSYVIVK